LSKIKLLITQVNDLELLVKKNSEVSICIMNNFILENLVLTSN
jgi:hypothetical protein